MFSFKVFSFFLILWGFAQGSSIQTLKIKLKEIEGLIEKVLAEQEEKERENETLIAQLLGKIAILQNQSKNDVYLSGEKKQTFNKVLISNDVANMIEGYFDHPADLMKMKMSSTKFINVKSRFENLFPNKGIVQLFMDSETNKCMWVGDEYEPLFLEFENKEPVGDDDIAEEFGDLEHTLQREIANKCCPESKCRVCQANDIFDWLANKWNNVYNSYISDVSAFGPEVNRNSHLFTGKVISVLANNVDVERNTFGYTPLILSILCDASEAFFTLIERGAEITERHALLHFAASRGNIEVVKFFVGRSATQVEESMMLDLATLYGRIGLVKFLVEKGVDINGTCGFVPLVTASQRGYFKIVKFLVDNGANVNICWGRPLVVACGGGFPKIVRFLINRGALVNGRDTRNATPLICATDEEHSEIVQILCSQHAATELKDTWNRRAIDIAHARKLVNIEDELNRMDNKRKRPQEDY